MNEKIVGIDVDSVLFPIQELVVIPAWVDAGLGGCMQDIVAFDYKACPNLTKAHEDVAFDQFRRFDLYDGHRPTTEARDALKELRSLYRVVVVTSPFAEHATSKWAYCQRAGFDHKDIVLCGDKGLVGIDVLVDDRAETALQLGKDRVVVFDRPWNRDLYGSMQDDRGHPFARAYGWEDVCRKVARLLA